MAEKDTGNLEKIQLQITGMHCASCAANLEKGLNGASGVKQAVVNFASERASIEYDPGKIGLSAIKDAVSELGFGVATRKSIFPVSGMT